MEKILRIEEGVFKSDKNSWTVFEGYIVVTDKQSIKIGISNEQSCCEDWGYLSTNDDLGDFIGTELRSVSITDTDLNTKNIEELQYLDAGGAMFVNINTSVGLLQIVCYNGHNGYYGHAVTVISEQIKHEDVL